MTLPDDVRERLADLVALQPTKNKELMDRWDMESGSEVHRYLEDELKAYYYRDENSLIRATAAAAELVGVDPDDETIQLSPLQAAIVDVIAGPDEEPESVVGVLQTVRDEIEPEPDVDAVRSALRSLADKGVLELVRTTVPTFRLAVERDSLTIDVYDPDAGADEEPGGGRDDSGGGGSDILADLERDLDLEEG